jgi:hypothetical protein
MFGSKNTSVAAITRRKPIEMSGSTSVEALQYDCKFVTWAIAFDVFEVNRAVCLESQLSRRKCRIAELKVKARQAYATVPWPAYSPA